jgi:hypothetical protein
VSLRRCSGLCVNAAADHIRLVKGASGLGKSSLTPLCPHDQRAARDAIGFELNFVLFIGADELAPKRTGSGQHSVHEIASTLT